MPLVSCATKSTTFSKCGWMGLDGLFWWEMRNSTGADRAVAQAGPLSVADTAVAETKAARMVVNDITGAFIRFPFICRES
ncbi:hypothetical protein EMEDMD4_910044 [Sinorhizobium medicae]|uniref:Uncharacterized protein n=1 Tax=Sinorhizobium medicae TaxID=110321 RepID=A0A508XC12_9HYPH|nr:hypothetical protein EMEDMD4_910044 [Sinorhizobium medicae]